MIDSFKEGDVVVLNDHPFLTATVTEVFGDSLKVEFVHDTDLQMWIKPSEVSGVNL